MKLFFSNPLVYDYLFGILILVMPFGNALSNISIIILVLLFGLRFQKSMIITWFKSPLFIIAVLVFYLVLQAFINKSFSDDLNYYSRYGYLILVPILVFGINNTQIVKIAAICSVNLIIIISLVNIFIFYDKFGFFPFADSWATNAVLVLERPYTGIYCLISIVLSLEQLLHNKKFKAFFVASLLISVLFIFFISIRISIISFVLISIIYSFFYFKRNIKHKVFMIISLVALLTTFLFLNPNITKRFFLESNIEKSLEKFKESEPRIIIWNCAKQVINQNDFSFFLGTNSYSNIKNTMVQCYKDSIQDYSRKNWFLSRKYNTHNQYLDFYLIGGAFALALLFYFLFNYFIVNKKNFPPVAVIICFTVMMFVENIFHRQFGCLIFTIFVTLPLNQKKQNA